MPTLTLFEHQAQPYADLNWEPHHPALELLEALNATAGAELVRVGRRALRATQYVGVLRAGEVTIQILPKIDYHPAGDAGAPAASHPHQAAAESATANLLHLLSYTHDFPIQEQDLAPLLARRSDWFEILTGLLARNLHRELKLGVERAYVRREEDLPVLRGRWQLAQQLACRPHVRHRFDVAYDEFSPDTLLNQVFAAVTGRLLWRTRTAPIRRLLDDICHWLDGVGEPPQLSVAHLDRVHFTRLNARFRPAFQLARLFVENRAFQLTGGRHDTFAFVFDMNHLFEAFVAGFLARHRRAVLPQGWETVRLQPQARGQALYLAERLPERQKAFRLRPDLLLTWPSGRAALVLDTKYKALDGHGVAEGDMYQMLAYAVALDCPHVLLLYPRPASGPIPRRKFEMQGIAARVTAATLDLHRPLDDPQPLINDLRTLLKEVSYHGSHAQV